MSGVQTGVQPSAQQSAQPSAQTGVQTHALSGIQMSLYIFLGFCTLINVVLLSIEPSTVVQGRIGSQGDRGVQGLLGQSYTVTGLPGLPGPVGPEGFRGFRGLQGTKGGEGLLGPNGERGALGFQGIQGPRGFQFQGFYGKTGAQGPQGLQGNRGVQSLLNGLQGIQGKQGVAGTAIGPQGHQGHDGFSGPNLDGGKGPQGIPGPSPGIQGSKGQTGDTTHEIFTELSFYDLTKGIFKSYNQNYDNNNSPNFAVDLPFFTYGVTSNTLPPNDSFSRLLFRGLLNPTSPSNVIPGRLSSYKFAISFQNMPLGYTLNYIKSELTIFQNTYVDQNILYLETENNNPFLRFQIGGEGYPFQETVPNNYVATVLQYLLVSRYGLVGSPLGDLFPLQIEIHVFNTVYIPNLITFNVCIICTGPLQVTSNDVYLSITWP